MLDMLRRCSEAGGVLCLRECVRVRRRPSSQSLEGGTPENSQKSLNRGGTVGSKHHMGVRERECLRRPSSQSLEGGTRSSACGF